MQSIEEINSLITPETGWTVELGVTAHDEFLRLYRVDKTSGARVFVTSLPRETPAGIICAFGVACRHYYSLGLADAHSGVGAAAHEASVPPELENLIRQAQSHMLRTAEADAVSVKLSQYLSNAGA